jgi:hypothetical protein
MAAATPQYLYMLDEDLYRLGNATLSEASQRPARRCENLRAQRRCDGSRRWFRNIARHRVAHRAHELTQFLAWKIPANFPMPPGLASNADPTSIRHPGDAPDQFFMPQSDMPLSEYVALVSKLALKLEGTKAMNIELQEWQARYLLEAMRALEHQWRDTAAHSDEDTAADLGNTPAAPVAVGNGEQPRPRQLSAAPNGNESRTVSFSLDFLPSRPRQVCLARALKG